MVQNHLESKYWGYILELTCDSPEYAKFLLSQVKRVQKFYGNELKAGPLEEIPAGNLRAAPHKENVVRLVVPIEHELKSIRLCNEKGEEIHTHRLKKLD